jgi:peptidoglycan/xylan/chitin deacetylase (PgdA/CDA1 family)
MYTLETYYRRGVILMNHRLSRRQFLAAAATGSLGLLANSQTLAASLTFRRINCPILMYHYISYAPEDADNVLRDLTVTPELFSEHLAFLQENGFTSVTMAQLWAALSEGAELPEKPIIFTFDDGYIDAYQHAMPRLLERGMTGLFYIVKNFMDQPGYLSWGQVVEMRNAGMEIGNHTSSHPNLSSLDYNAQFDEIDGAAAAIGEVLGARPPFFCYPLGRYNASTIQVLKDTGHITATTTSDGTLKYSTDPFRMSRLRIRNTTTVSTLGWLVNRVV